MITMKIEGMMCPHCQAAVTKALNAVEGVTKTEVSLEDKAAYVEAGEGISRDALKKAVADAGYEVTGIASGPLWRKPVFSPNICAIWWKLGSRQAASMMSCQLWQRIMSGRMPYPKISKALSLTLWS